MIYLELFWSFFQVGLFSIGGGYAAMPLIQDQVVDIHPWLTMTGFADIMAIAEMTPGPIALNAATFVGIQVAGLPGALIATIQMVLCRSSVRTVEHRQMVQDSAQTAVQSLHNYQIKIRAVIITHPVTNCF